MAMLFHEQPTDPWNSFDFMLVEALQILEDETCGKCGNPIWICRNSDAAHLGFKVKTSICYASAEMEKWQDKKEKNKSAKKVFGELPYIVPFTYDDSPMPTRSSYYKGLSDKIE